MKCRKEDAAFLNDLNLRVWSFFLNPEFLLGFLSQEHIQAVCGYRFLSFVIFDLLCYLSN